MWPLAALLDRRQSARSGRSCRATAPPSVPVEGGMETSRSSAEAFARLGSWDFPKPTTQSLGSFVKWWIENGGELDHIDDVDELTALHQWFWSRQSQPEPEQNTEEPPMAPIATVSHPLPAEKPPARDVQSPLARTTQQASEAAERFVEWVQLSGKAGSFNSQELSELYREHCRAEDLVPVAENMLRAALIKLHPRVTKTQLDKKAERGKSSRKRNYRWTIAVGATVSTNIPWPELPQRRAA